MNPAKETVWTAFPRFWRITALAWRTYMRKHAKTWREARRTGHDLAAAASLTQALLCRRQWQLADQKRREAEGRAA